MTNRINNIDLIRGIALLGLPFMNLISFAMPYASYLNPMAYTPGGDLDQAVFSVVHVVADQKFMGLFSLLFGASLMLLVEKCEQTGRSAASVHYRRNFWLLVFGGLHALLLWDGDILLVYAVLGMLIYPLHRTKPIVLVILGSLVMWFAVVLAGGMDVSVDAIGQEGRAVVMKDYQPDDRDIGAEIAVYQSDYNTIFDYRANGGSTDEISQQADDDTSLVRASFALAGIMRALAMMLFGMALYQWRILQLTRSARFYQAVAAIGLSTGVAVAIYGLLGNYQHDWSADYFYDQGMIAGLFAMLLMSGGYVGLISWWCLSDALSGLQAKIQSVGRMALTNYLMQSVIAVFIFQGFGLGLFGALSRLELVGVAILIGVFQLGFSTLWLSFFRQGPVEQVWRWLTYGSFKTG